MDDPAPEKDAGRICPHCKKPVPPGYKFCEVCGTKIPSLLTCSRCGTQFVHPQKYCECCGAKFVPKEIATEEPEEAPGAGEPPGTAEDAALEPPDAEMPVPGAEEFPEEPEFEGPAEPAGEEETGSEDLPEPIEDGTPEEAGRETAEPVEGDALEPDELRHYKRTDGRIREPDTEELLEKFGKEFDEAETLASPHTALRPATRLPTTSRGSAGRDDGALSPAERRRVRLPANTMRAIGITVAVIAILALVWFIGLPLLAKGIGHAADAPVTPAPGPATTQQPAGKVTTAAAAGALVPAPTETIPGSQEFSFLVRKNPITLKISVIFIGSASPGTINSAEVKVTRPDGSVGSGIHLPLKGINEISIGGSGDADRVEILAKMGSGKTYRVYDALVSLMR